MKKLFVVLTFLFAHSCYAQVQFIEKIKAADSLVVGGSSLSETRDSGFIVAGSIGFPQGNFNPYIVRLDKNGDTLWSQIITGLDGSWSKVIESQDSGFISCGSRIASGGKLDAVIQKSNSKGTP